MIHVDDDEFDELRPDARKKIKIWNEIYGPISMIEKNVKDYDETQELYHQVLCIYYKKTARFLLKIENIFI